MTHALCNKITCGTLNAALMAHKKLTKLLRSWGLEMNPCDPCAWNKIVMEKQLTLMFHTDDAMLNHVCPQVVAEHIKKLDGSYGSKDPLTATRGKIHECLGVTIDFRMKGRCAFPIMTPSRSFG